MLGPVGAMLGGWTPPAHFTSTVRTWWFVPGRLGPGQRRGARAGAVGRFQALSNFRPEFLPIGPLGLGQLRHRGGVADAGQVGIFRAAAQAMRRILVDQARARSAAKRDGGQRFELSEADRVLVPDPDTLLAVDEALATLAAAEPASADVARLRLFAGLSVEEAGAALGVSRATAYRDWAYAQAFLSAALGGEK